METGTNEHSDMFDLKILPTVVSLWNELGIPETQRNQEIDTLTDSFVQLYNEFVAHLTDLCQDTRYQISDIQSKHRQAMKAFGVSDEDIEEHFSSDDHQMKKNLLKVLDVTKQSYESFKLEIAERVQKIENLVHMANELFDLFETPMENRGEFISVGETDFTRERIDRFRVKISELNSEKEKKSLKAQELKESIQRLIKELNTKLCNEDMTIYDATVLSENQLEKLNSLRIKLEKKKIQRVIEISELAVTITHLWDLLNIPDNQRSEFLSSHSTLGDDVIQSCQEEVDVLSKLRDQKLPELIAEQRQEVVGLWNLLHVAVESRPRFDDHHSSNNNSDISSSQSSASIALEEENESEKNVREFKFLETEIIRLKKVSVECHSLLENINQREDILKEYNEVLEATSDPHRLMSRGRGCAQQLMKEEKARRRFKVSLPRLEKKLYSLLIEYKTKNGIDFEWDGKPYIENLSHITPDQIKPSKSSKKVVEDTKKCRTLPPSPRKAQFINNENAPNNNIKAFSIRARSPIKM